MLNKLKEIEANAAAAIAAMKDGTALEAARVKYLGKKGELTAILRGMGSLSADERPVIGAAANVIRQNIEAAIEKGSRAEGAVHEHPPCFRKNRRNTSRKGKAHRCAPSSATDRKPDERNIHRYGF